MVWLGWIITSLKFDVLNVPVPALINPGSVVLSAHDVLMEVPNSVDCECVANVTSNRRQNTYFDHSLAITDLER